jgi:acetylglutamate kinase
VAPSARARNGETYNINGDTAAGAIAAALQGRPAPAPDRRGRREGREGEVVTALSAAEVEEMTASGTIAAA